MSREVMQQALEALELHGKEYPHMVESYCLKAIIAIKAALAQPEQERSCGICGEDEAFTGSCGGGRNKPTALCYTPLPQPVQPEQWTPEDMAYRPGGLAQPEQEPVALPDGKRLILVDGTFDELVYWLDRCEDKGHLENCYDLVEPWANFKYEDYTSPPQRQTEQEPMHPKIEKLYEDFFDKCFRESPPQRDWEELTDADRKSYQAGHNAGVKHQKQIAKREWVGLTDAEILQKVNDCTFADDLHADKFARAIEAKLKAKNE